MERQRLYGLGLYQQPEKIFAKSLINPEYRDDAVLTTLRIFFLEYNGNKLVGTREADTPRVTL